MSAVELALPRLQTEEGFRASAYKDTNGFTTLGYGFNVDAGISAFAASALLVAQATERHRELLRFPWYARLDEPRQSALLDIAFNTGVSGLLHFPHLIAALELGNWEIAAAECHVEDPKLAGRYAKLAKILESGVA